MGSNPDFLTCPMCERLVAVTVGRCGACGLVLPVEGDRPTSFRFPAVPNAYVPSGRWTLPALLLALAAALPAGAVGGAALIFLHYVFLRLMWGIASGLRNVPGVGILGVIVIFGGHVLLSFALVIAIRVVLRWCTRTARLRNPGLERGVAIGSGAAACAVYAAIGFSLPLFRVELEGSQPLVFTAFALLGFGLILYSLADRGGTSASDPFCEDCQQFMEQEKRGSFPTKKEEQLLKEFTAHDYAPLSRGAPTTESASYCDVWLYYCARCRSSGYLTVETHLDHFHNGNKKEMSRHPEARLVFSSSLGAQEIQILRPLPGGSPGELSRDVAPLDEKERRILALVSQGADQARIAEQVGESRLRVGSITSELRKRFGAENNEELVRRARDSGVLPPS